MPLVLENAQKLKGLMGWDDLNFLAQLASTHSRILELGSYYGRSTRALADNTEGFVIACDNFKGPEDLVISWKERQGLYDKFIANMGEHITTKKVIPWKIGHEEITREGLNNLIADNFGSTLLPAEMRPTGLDMIFIDGSHRYEHVLRDIRTAMVLLESGGVICGHDYDMASPGVVQAVTELVPGYTVTDHSRVWWSDVYLKIEQEGEPQ